jgi:hypothetical protein
MGVQVTTIPEKLLDMEAGYDHPAQKDGGSYQ